MSETFYIKKTAFDDNETDLTLRESDSFIIGPGELNGPGGRVADSDLELYGFGSLKWGEGVNQNQYRQLESNACPAKFAGSPPVQVSPIVPADEDDLGIGNGITNPLVGQLWYNTTNNILYNFELTGWETVFKEAVDALTDHIDNDFHLHLTSFQNTFLDDLNLTTPATAEALALRVLALDDLDLGLGGGKVQGQLDLMVEKTGDQMTGVLGINMGASNSTALLISQDTSPSIELRAGLINSGFARISYRDGGGAIRAQTSSHSTTGQYTVIVQSAGAGLEATMVLESDGNLSLIGGANIPTEPDHLTRLDYVNTKAPIASPALTGVPTAPTVANLADSSTKIATTAFVKQNISAAGADTVAIQRGATTISTSLWLYLPPGQWLVQAHVRFHQSIWLTNTLTIDGTVVDTTTNIGELPGTGYIFMFGDRVGVTGGRSILTSYTTAGCFPSLATCGKKLEVKAWKTGV